MTNDSNNSVGKTIWQSPGGRKQSLMAVIIMSIIFIILFVVIINILNHDWLLIVAVLLYCRFVWDYLYLHVMLSYEIVSHSDYVYFYRLAGTLVVKYEDITGMRLVGSGLCPTAIVINTTLKKFALIGGKQGFTPVMSRLRKRVFDRATTIGVLYMMLPDDKELWRLLSVIYKRCPDLVITDTYIKEMLEVHN